MSKFRFSLRNIRTVGAQREIEDRLAHDVCCSECEALFSCPCSNRANHEMRATRQFPDRCPSCEKAAQAAWSRHLARTPENYDTIFKAR